MYLIREIIVKTQVRFQAVLTSVQVKLNLANTVKLSYKWLLKVRFSFLLLLCRRSHEDIELSQIQQETGDDNAYDGA